MSILRENELYLSALENQLGDRWRGSVRCQRLGSVLLTLMVRRFVGPAPSP